MYYTSIYVLYVGLEYLYTVVLYSDFNFDNIYKTTIHCMLTEGMYSNEPTSSSDNCNGRDGSDGGGGGGGGNIDLELNTNNIYNTTLTSFFVATIVATVIILILILIMCGMGMSMLKMKYQCIYNMCRCCLGKKTKGECSTILRLNSDAPLNVSLNYTL